MSKKNFTVARIVTHTQASIGKCERHNERKNESYGNMNVDLGRTPMNIHFRDCGRETYNETLDKLVADGTVSLRGLKEDAKVYDEMILDVNSDYFEQHGGYEFAKRFYTEAYRFAIKVYGKEQILSAVMHADEINLALTEKYGHPVYHYHLHIVALPVVEKQVLWSKRCKDPALVGTVKETIQQVSHSKKWKSQRVTDEDGKTALLPSYRILQDEFFHHMGKRGITGKVTISKEDFELLTELAKEGISGRGEIQRLKSDCSRLNMQNFDLQSDLKCREEQLDALITRCRPYWQAAKIEPEKVKAFLDSILEPFRRKEEKQAETILYRKGKVRTQEEKNNEVGIDGKGMGTLRTGAEEN